MFGRAKSKAAFRGRSKELAELMVGAGLTIWEDLRGVDLAWLETTVGVPHFEALAFFRFLDDSAQQVMQVLKGHRANRFLGRAPRGQQFFIFRMAISPAPAPASPAQINFNFKINF